MSACLYAVEIQAIAHCFGLPAAARGKVTHAIEASFVPAIRKLSTAVVKEADIARFATIRVIKDEVDTFAIRSPAGSAAAGRSARGILAARREKEARRGEKGKSDQKGAHRVL